MRTIGTIALALACLAGFHSAAKETPASIMRTLSAAPAAELPAVAGKLVRDAAVREREQTTIDVIKASLALNPAAAPLVVAAIAREVPEMVPVAVRAAVAEQPKQSFAITKAAAAAAPARAGGIVTAVCGVVPGQYRDVAVAAAEGAPTSGREILKSVGAAAPELKPSLDRQSTRYGLGILPVASVLDQAIAETKASGSVSVSTAGLAGQGVSARPAAVPPAPTPAGAVPNSNSPEHRGGRNYARP